MPRSILDQVMCGIFNIMQSLRVFVVCNEHVTLLGMNEILLPQIERLRIVDAGCK